MKVFFKELKQNILLYLALFLLFSNYMLFTAFDWGGEDSFTFFKNIIRIISLFLLFLYVGQVGKIKYSIFSCFLIVLGLYAINGNDILLNIFFFLIIFACLFRVKLDNIVVFAFTSYVIYFVLHNFFIFTGILENSISTFDERIRNSYGFSNVNRLGIFYFYFFMLNFYMIAHNNKAFYKKIVFYFFALSSIIYILLSDARTSLFLCILIVILWQLSKFDLFYKLQRFALNFVIFFSAGVSFYLASKGGESFNEVLSYRPAFFKQYTDLLFENNISIFFGVPLNEDITVDNSYIIFSGAIGIVLSFIIYLFSPIISYKKYIPRAYVIMIIASLLYGVFESNLLRVEMLVPIFVLFCLFFGKKENFS
ncbi:hypothetical protein [Acinetobacter baumannii]|uniref:hypothetical protein n=1 Tax=Acinetobacter baumannii TaxID=470 RepID=UPI00054B7345|nr:hypothetical protein [Acinetobacter baumannii]EJB8457052.1 hypothetical protein [Acinetobacter baumannii]MCG6603251.1 hypothetical protein [Acinetobacter baumannii]MDA4943091.1 hypothetical protein [Acinetobacter baumannii]MDH2549104.1 hypothetical protein [Acinetobacter baumannii]MDH2646890.1 hypothetical protein [Acinetobacter baumannii]